MTLGIRDRSRHGMQSGPWRKLRTTRFLWPQIVCSAPAIRGTGIAVQISSDSLKRDPPRKPPVTGAGRALNRDLRVELFWARSTCGKVDAFPARDYCSCHAVAEQVYRGAGHVHQCVGAQQERDT